MNELLEKLRDESKHEGTSFPFWLIIEPRKNLRKDSQSIQNIASMIIGVFFSRKDAQDFLDRTRYNFSKYATVYCHSGYNSLDWRKLYETKKLTKE